MVGRGHYVAGACNIGRPEVRLRKAYGWTFVGITAAWAFWAGLGNLGPLMSAAIAIPATLAAFGLLQGYLNFCAAYGMRGRFNFGSRIGTSQPVRVAEARRRDRAAALALSLSALAIGGSTSVLVWILGPT